MALFGRSPRRTHPSPRQLTASGMVVDLRNPDVVQTLAMTRAAWQPVAWNYRKAIGELGQALRMKANLISKVGFAAAYQPPGEDEPVILTGDPKKDQDEDGKPLVAPRVAQAAIECLAQLPWDEGYGFTGRMVTGFDVAGEFWLHGFPGEDGEEEWKVRSTSEVVPSGIGGLAVVVGPGIPPRPLDPENETLIRQWVPDPEFADYADSPLRTLLDVCEDVVLCGREIRAAAMSRIASNGILKVPTGVAMVRDGSPTATPQSSDFLAGFTAAVTAPINNEGHVSAVVPIIVTGDPEDLVAFDHLEITRRTDESVLGRQSAGLGRIADSIDLPAEAMKGTIGEANHWCLDEETEVLTRRGWVTIDGFQPGDEVLALDHATGVASWATTDDVYTADVVDEPMRLLESRTHSSLTTLNHRWPTVTPWGARRWRTSGQLNAYDAITTGAPVGDLPTVAKYSDALVELAAWFWTEGNLNQGGTLTIAQSHTVNPDRVASIRRALLTEFGPNGWTERIQPNLSSFGGPITVFRLRSAARDALSVVAPAKRPTMEFVDGLTLAQLHLFIDTSCRGDGHHWRTGQRDIWQRDPDALGAYERACILAGYAVSRQPGHDGGTTVRALRTTQVRPVKAAEQMRRTGKSGAVDQVVTYTGRVWCPTVPDLHSYLARRGGRTFYTGNSAWLIDAQTFDNHLAPGCRLIADALTPSYFRRRLMAPPPLGWGLTREEAHSVRVWYDASTLTRNTNRSADADAAMDRGALNYDAYLTAKGFDPDTDKATEEDLQRLQMVKSGRLDPVTMTQLAHMLLGLKEVLPASDRIIGNDGQVIDGQVALPPGGPAAPTNAQLPIPGRGQGPARPIPQAPAGVAASAAAPQGVLDSVRLIDSTTLANIDAALIEKIRNAAEAELAAALRRAGNKINAQVQGKDKALAEQLKGTDPAGIGAMVGYDRLGELGLTEDLLLAAAFTYLSGKFAGWTLTAIKQAALGASELVQLPLVVVNRLASTMADRIPTAWKKLEASLRERATNALYGRRGDTAPDGEVPDTIILPGDIRDALGEIGGPGGLAMGADVLREIDHRAERVGFEWRYGITPRERGFHPHRELAGGRFEGFDDPKLATGPATAWLGPYLHPGDHEGCLCDAVYSWMAKDADAEARRLAEQETGPMQAERLLAQIDDAAGRSGTHSQRTRDERDRMVEVQTAWLERRAPR